MKWALLTVAMFVGTVALFAAVPPSSILRAVGFAAPTLDRFDDSAARLVDQGREYVDEARRRIAGVVRIDGKAPRIFRGPPDQSVPAPRSGPARIIEVDTLDFEGPRIVRATPDRSVPAQWSGPARVIDGDTLEVEGTRIRLHGIDAPESAQTCRTGGRPWSCGLKAARALGERIGGTPVTCDERDRDRYDRVVAVCRHLGRDVNAWLVREGWALAYRRYSLEYVDDEAAARSARRGIWRGEFVRPWDWRQGIRLATADRQPAIRDRQPATTASDARGRCDIKGNVSHNSGRRIYHMPADRDYARTQIDPSRGERWFCSESEARAAGWRRARR